MSLDRQYGRLTFVCDGDKCPETFTGGQGDEFTETWSAATSEGWKARKIAGEWMHFCAGCEP